MTSHLLKLSAAWRETTTLVEAGKSVVLISPRHYGKWSLLEDYAIARAVTGGTKFITVSSFASSLDGGIDYSRLWEMARRQLGVRSRSRVIDGPSFELAFQSAAGENKQPIIALIGGAIRGNEENHYELLSTFHRLLVHWPRKSICKLTVLAVDDYSLFYFNKRHFLLSELHSYTRIHVLPTNAHDISACVFTVSCGAVSQADARVMGEGVFAVSGGHLGVAEEIVRGLELAGWPRTREEQDAQIGRTLRASNVLESMSRALEEDAQAYSVTALEYREPACPEHNTPRIHVLRQLGVLLPHAPPLVQLCSGAITGLVEAFSQPTQVATPGRVGTIVSEIGPRLFEEGPVTVTDDDFVVLHLSDLHVSKHYRHRLTWKGGQLNSNEHSAGDLLRADLEADGLVGRIDAMVLSGDFVWEGSGDEFRRAREVIKEIFDAVQINADRVVFVPGNHDVRWNPGDLGSVAHSNSVSREDYDDFLRLLGKGSVDVDLVDVANRAGSASLRILGLDSNRVEGPKAPGIGYVSRESFAAAKALLDERTHHREDRREYTWLVVHHHVFPATAAPLANAEARQVSVMANAAEVLDYANQWRAELILHGHEHQPCITVARRWPIDVGEVFAPIASLGAGSFGVSREYLGPFSRNQYFLVYRRPTGILVRSRCQGAGGIRFIPHSDMWLPRPR